jgi:tRNA modification GTPase
MNSPHPVSGMGDGVLGGWGEDTIVAVSTATGRGAIGIVRLSGPEALDIAAAAFRPAALSRTDGELVHPAERSRDILQESHRLHYGHILDPRSGEVLDEVMVAVMRAPRTYTREDVVEVDCHGGPVAQQAVLRLLVALGARSAEPGEFTKRAFLNGRIDLTQAESVAAIVAARSTMALRASLRQLEGGLSDRLRVIRRDLIGALAAIEATVDFSDEDVDEVDWDAVEGALCAAEFGLARLLQTAFLGRVLEQGVRTAIVGRPNVGKSSLLNALLMRERAIVSDIPGTTRDTVEELMEIGGIPIHLVDTAGMRNGGDHVEKLGVERSMRAIEQADLILAVVDLSESWTADDAGLLQRFDPARAIIVGNKCDLVAEDEARRLPTRLKRAGTEGPWISCVVSARTGEGLDALRQLIQRVVTGDQGVHLEEPVLAGERQRSLVKEALDSTSEALQGVRQSRGEELVCEDIRAAVQALGRMTGEELTLDLLDEIFSRFCIGK